MAGEESEFCALAAISERLVSHILAGSGKNRGTLHRHHTLRTAPDEGPDTGLTRCKPARTVDQSCVFSRDILPCDTANQRYPFAESVFDKDCCFPLAVIPAIPAFKRVVEPRLGPVIQTRGDDQAVTLIERPGTSVNRRTGYQTDEGRD